MSNLLNEAIALENTGDVGIYCTKKKLLTLPGAGVQFPVLLQQSIASNRIINRFPEKVNISIVDATQSQPLKRWFGNPFMQKNRKRFDEQVADESGIDSGLGYDAMQKKTCQYGYDGVI